MNNSCSNAGNVPCIECFDFFGKLLNDVFIARCLDQTP